MLPAPRRVQAFSLIELLVVVAIIAVLAGLILPAVGLVRDAAGTARCAGNLRQVFIAYGGYAADNDGLVARANIRDWRFWYQYVADYAEAVSGDALANPDRIGKDSILWNCPAYPQRQSAVWWQVPYGVNMWLQEPVRDPATGWRYGNGIFEPPNGWTGAFREFHLASLDRISSRCLVADANGWCAPGGITRHRGRGNVVFCDGHVAACTLVEQILSVDDPTKLP